MAVSYAEDRVRRLRCNAGLTGISTVTMATAQNNTLLHATSETLWLADRFLACADACERLAHSPGITQRIAAAALECSNTCYLAAALRAADENLVAELILRRCRQHCIALVLACASVSEAATCVALCRECELLCGQRCQQTQGRGASALRSGKILDA